MEGRQLGSDLRIGCLGGVVVPRGSSWHFLIVGGVLLLLWCLLFGVAVTGLRIFVC